MENNKFESLRKKLLATFESLTEEMQEEFVMFAQDLLLAAEQRLKDHKQKKQMSILDLLPPTQGRRCDGCNAVRFLTPCPNAEDCDYNCMLCASCVAYQKKSKSCKKALRGEYKRFKEQKEETG